MNRYRGHHAAVTSKAHPTAAWSAFAVATLFAVAPASAVPVTIVKAGDAAIAHDADAGVWFVSAGGAVLTIRADPGFDFSVPGLIVTATGREWISSSVPDTTVSINGTARHFGVRLEGFDFESATAIRQQAGVRLDIAYTLSPPAVRVTRHYFAVPGSASFETWTTMQSLRGGDTASDLNALQLTIPNGTIRWVTGLNGDNATVTRDSAFSISSRALADGATQTLGSTRRSSETALPFVMVDGSPDEFFAALLWAGAWALNAKRTDTAISVDFGLGPMTTAIGPDGLDGPHALFGVVRGGVAQATAALRTFAAAGLRENRPLTPMVTYNTWFAYGTTIDDASIRSEMTRVARLGVELFVVDAGWYVGAGRAGSFDFESGLGSWQEDSARFPVGLRGLRDYAHSIGLKFGVWAEPERVNLSTVGGPGLIDDASLVKTGGSYGAKTTALICLSGARGRAWVQSQLFSLIDRVQPDYLKWDNNLWVNCDREGHGHGVTDGNFVQTKGFYDTLAAMRDRYPDLMVETVAGGGNRLEIGLLRYSEVTWMDDRTTPSVHVRHNAEGLAQLFPTPFLLSFLLDNSAEPMHQPPDLALYARSRMTSVLGLCFNTSSLTEGDLSAIAAQIASYKALRAAQLAGTAVLLSAQAKSTGGPSWDVIQWSNPQQTVIFAFQNDAAVARVLVKPTGLTSTATYEVRSADGASLGSFRGSSLAASGIEVTAANSAAQLLVITAK